MTRSTSGLLGSYGISRLLIGAGFGVLIWVVFRRFHGRGNKGASLPPPRRLLPTDLRLTHEQLAEFNGVDPNKPIYIAMKGKIYDVGLRNPMYEVGGSYNVFAGKEANRALALVSTDPADAIPDMTGLSPSQLESLDNWADFFEGKYTCVGVVVSA